MAYFDITKIEQILKDEELFSDNLSHKSLESLERIFEAKVESQKWCLGLDVVLQHHTAVKGFLQRTDPVEQEVPMQPDGHTSWIAIALAERGVKEIKGGGSNSRIGEYLKTVGHAPNDAIPWCSAFVNWVMMRAGYKGTRGLKPGAAYARSWLNWGKEVPAGTIGSVVVFPRGNYPSGHVAICIAIENDRVTVVGGNQSDEVNIRKYPISSVLGWRWPNESSK